MNDAYELAEFIETGGENIDRKELANMLRQQADRIAELEKDLHMIQRHYDQLDTQTKPLSDEEINQIAKDELIGWACDEDMLSFARAIEERHGIK